MNRRIAYLIITLALGASMTLAAMQVRSQTHDPAVQTMESPGMRPSPARDRPSTTRSSIAGAQPTTGSTQPSARGPLIPDDYAILRTRNVFGRGRGRGGPAGDVEASLVFKGVIQAEARFNAFIEDLKTKKVTTVAEGDAIGRGRIQSIDIDALMYETEGQSRRIEVGQNLNGQMVAPTPTSMPSTPGGARGRAGPAGENGPNPPNLPPGRAGRGAPPPQVEPAPPPPQG